MSRLHSCSGLTCPVDQLPGLPPALLPAESSTSDHSALNLHSVLGTNLFVFDLKVLVSFYILT